MLARLAVTAAVIRLGAWAGDRRERADRRLTDLTRMVDRFECALRDVPYELARPVHARIRHAHTALDFWYMRTSVFNVIAMTFGQEEAQARIAQLNRLFANAGERSGPVPL